MDRLELLSCLPGQLLERVEVRHGTPLPKDGSFLLYWMRTALRADENPALETALRLSRELDLPVFVYQGLTERYPFASDRHHFFILQGARDVAEQLAQRGIGYALHVEREGHRGPHLRDLASRAAVVITEEMPVAPLDRWTARLAETSNSPLLTVDTSCIVPMRLTTRAFGRAFQYRRATAALRRERLAQRWTASDPVHGPYLPDLPFEPVDPGNADFEALTGTCRIDHSIAPVPHTRGGSRAGYERWSLFREKALRSYHRRRNNPLADGVSRMSAYLHYGMVSPFHLAREAAADGSQGAQKYLDELLVWRELAYSYCFHQPDHRRADALPAWALDTLSQHEGDERPYLPSWETLARAQSGDALWDAAQTQLVRHGELHNNVRMTWGKALVSWTQNAEEALRLLEDLNHRFALDGRDPSSYGGILWCLGLFDRPFQPERPILGSLRPRPTEQHARRLDVERYAAKTYRSPFSSSASTLVIGGGIAGLACARTLDDAGIRVQVLDKGASPGGRAATRMSEEGSVDHGAQYFTARDPRFQAYVRSWQTQGLVAPWTGRIGTLDKGVVTPSSQDTERFVGIPGMSAIGHHLASDLAVLRETRIIDLSREGDSWIAVSADGGRFQAEEVVLALPAPQALRLLPSQTPLYERVASVRMAPCWAVLASFDRAVDLDLDGAFVSRSPLAWAARDSSKPGRAAGEQWVLHAGTDWSSEHLDECEDSVAQALIAAFARASRDRSTANHQDFCPSLAILTSHHPPGAGLSP